MSKISSTDKVVTQSQLEQNFADFYDEIRPCLNGSYPTLAAPFALSNLYSTSEKLVGQWTDGKPLYQKTVSTTISNTLDTWQSINIGATIDKVANSFSIVDYTSGGEAHILTNIALTYGAAQSTNAGAGQGLKMRINTNLASQNKNTIQYYNGNTAWKGATLVTTIQYTKPNDSATQNFNTPSNYSTAEQIVGTWIDGKPLYQKTVSCGALPNATTKIVAHNISNVDYIIDYHGISMNPTSHISVILPYAGGGEDVTVFVDRTNIKIMNKVDNTNYIAAYVTLQYTKTTD